MAFNTTPALPALPQPGALGAAQQKGKPYPRQSRPCANLLPPSTAPTPVIHQRWAWRLCCPNTRERPPPNTPLHPT